MQDNGEDSEPKSLWLKYCFSDEIINHLWPQFFLRPVVKQNLCVQSSQVKKHSRKTNLGSNQTSPVPRTEIWSFKYFSILLFVPALLCSRIKPPTLGSSPTPLSRPSSPAPEYSLLLPDYHYYLKNISPQIIIFDPRLQSHSCQLLDLSEQGLPKPCACLLRS